MVEDRFRELLEDVGASQTWNDDETPGKLCHAFFGGDDDQDARSVASSVGAISTTLHWLKPQDFAPYFFEGRFALFAEICRMFGVALPEIPGPLQKNERALYYLSVNKALQEFRHRNHLSHRELNAFLYVFAPQYLAVEQDRDLPKPQRVWFMMAGVGTTADFDFLDTAKEGTQCNWCGNRDAQRGGSVASIPPIYVPALPLLPADAEILDERQVRVRMGRGEKVYPDYLVGYRGGKGEERATIVVESKYRIGIQKQLFETFLQGRAYALRL